MAATDNHSHFGTARVTPQRRRIAHVVDAMPGAFTVDDLASAVREGVSGTGTATVYRAVAAMESAGAVERVGSRDGSALYTRCRADHHHHHLVCTGCGAVAPTACPLERGASLRGTRDGYVVTSHEITLYGLCPSCARQTHPEERSRKD